MCMSCGGNKPSGNGSRQPMPKPQNINYVHRNTTTSSGRSSPQSKAQKFGAPTIKLSRGK